MNAEADELAVRDGCLYLVCATDAAFFLYQSILKEALMQVDIFQDFPEVKDYFIKAHGLLTIVESLQSIRSREVISLELRIVNLVSSPGHIDTASSTNLPFRRSLATIRLVWRKYA